MTSPRTRFATATAITATLLVALTGLSAPADAATARTATLSASPAREYAGKAVTFAGKVTKSPKGSVVKLQRKSGTTWVSAGQTKTTTAAGAYAVKLTLPGTPATYTYRALAPKTTKLAGTFSKAVKVTALRKTTATLTASPATIVTGASSTLSGSVSPYVAGTKIALQRLTGSTWVAVTSVALTSSGTFSTTVKPTATTTYRVQTPLTGLNAGTVSPSRSVTVTPATPAGPAISTSTLPDATRGTAYSVTLAHTGGAGTWSLQAALPTGLSLNATTGEISGTTYVALGTYGVYPVFTETASGKSVTKALPLTVGGTPLTITTDTNLPDGHKDLPYSVTFSKIGGPGTWTLTQAPDGFSIDPLTGTMTGTPTTPGINSVVVAYQETGGTFLQKGFSLKVIAPKVTTTSIPGAVTGTPYSTQLEKTGLDGTWTYSGQLPDGITFTSAGLISGTATETGEFPLVVTFTETATGNFSKQAYSLHVEAPGSPQITTTSLPNGTVGTPYSATLAATPTGGTWAVTTGSLPVGLSLNPTTGVISGTPTVPENALFVVTYTKGATKNTKFFSLTVPTPAG